jgi:hypothetical protein
VKKEKKMKGRAANCQIRSREKGSHGLHLRQAWFLSLIPKAPAPPPAAAAARPVWRCAIDPPPHAARAPVCYLLLITDAGISDEDLGDVKLLSSLKTPKLLL